MADARARRSYEKLKTLLADKDGKLSVPARLAAGAGAACLSTIVRSRRISLLTKALRARRPDTLCLPQATYPLDIIRFRMAVDPTLNTIPQVVRAVIRDEGIGAFYKGLLPSCIGIAPYSSINFAAFDLCVTRFFGCRASLPQRRPFLHALCCSLKKALPEDVAGQSSAVFACSLAAAALVRASRLCVSLGTPLMRPLRVQATGGCYPLDTIRRQMQLKSSTYSNVFTACAGIIARDGVGGLYRGFLPNAAKNLPNSSIRLSTFDGAKRLLRHSEAAYKAEVAAAAAEAKAAAKAKR